MRDLHDCQQLRENGTFSECKHIDKTHGWSDVFSRSFTTESFKQPHSLQCIRNPPVVSQISRVLTKLARNHDFDRTFDALSIRMSHDGQKSIFKDLHENFQDEF